MLEPKAFAVRRFDPQQTLVENVANYLNFNQILRDTGFNLPVGVDVDSFVVPCDGLYQFSLWFNLIDEVTKLFAGISIAGNSEFLWPTPEGFYQGSCNGQVELTQGMICKAMAFPESAEPIICVNQYFSMARIA